MTERLKPTESELEILQLLWHNGPSTVRAVNEQLNEKRDVGYTTSLKIMQIMHEKGLLTRRKEGKTHIYTANIDEEETQNKLVDRLIDSAFSGSAMKLVVQALGHRKTSAEELDAIREFLDSMEGKE